MGILTARSPAISSVSMSQIGSVGFLLLTLTTFSRLMLGEGQKGIPDLLSGEKSVWNLKTEILKPSVTVGLLCAAMVIVIGKKIKSSSHMDFLPWALIADQAGKRVTVMLTRYDEPLTPVLEELLLSTLFLAVFLLLTFLIEEWMNLGAHVSWILYCCITVLVIKFW